MRDWLPDARELRHLPALVGLEKLTTWLGTLALTAIETFVLWLYGGPPTAFGWMIAVLILFILTFLTIGAARWGLAGSPLAFWERWEGQHFGASEISQNSQPRPSPLAIPPARPVTTAPIDVPTKIAALDRLLAILDRDMPPWINKGSGLATGGWWNLLAAGKAQEMRQEVIGWRDEHDRISALINGIRHDNEKFPDIAALATQSYTDAFIPKLNGFLSAIVNLGDTPNLSGDALRHFVHPPAYAAYEALTPVEEWRKNTIRRAISLRQTLSQ